MINSKHPPNPWAASVGWKVTELWRLLQRRLPAKMCPQPRKLPPSRPGRWRAPKLSVWTVTESLNDGGRWKNPQKGVAATPKQDMRYTKTSHHSEAFIRTRKAFFSGFYPYKEHQHCYWGWTPKKDQSNSASAPLLLFSARWLMLRQWPAPVAALRSLQRHVEHFCVLLQSAFGNFWWFFLLSYFGGLTNNYRPFRDY